MPAAKKVGQKPKTATRRRPNKTALPAPKKGAKKKKPRPNTPNSAVRRKKPASAFGRVKLPVDARLDIVFQKDYQAREIFDFLKVQTIRELEEFAPIEIIERLTGPLTQTVERIRKTLALANRHLAKDERFAKAFLAEVLRSQ